MIFDTDILIWYERGNFKAAQLIQEVKIKFISVYTFLEFVQGARDKKHLQLIKNFFAHFNFNILPFTEPIGSTASEILLKHKLSNSIDLGDSIIAATAIENRLPLLSSNVKHFKIIPHLHLIPFTPES